MMILLVTGTVGTSIGLKLASDRLTEVEAQKRRANDEAAVTRAVNDFLQNDLLGKADIGNQTGHGGRDRSISVRDLLDQAAQRIATRFDGQELTEAAIRRTVGKAYRAVGEYPQAQKHLERSLALRSVKLQCGPWGPYRQASSSPARRSVCALGTMCHHRVADQSEKGKRIMSFNTWLRNV